MISFYTSFNICINVKIKLSFPILLCAIDISMIFNISLIYNNRCKYLIGDEDRATRRVSYLKATWGERMHVDSDLELSDSEPVHIHRR